jgi:hypothetical protein
VNFNVGKVLCGFVENEVGAILRGAGEEGTVFGCL